MLNDRAKMTAIQTNYVQKIEIQLMT